MVWQTDLSQINHALRELQRLNAKLEEEQDLLAQEIHIQSDEASVQARNDIYDSLSSEVSGQLTLLTDTFIKRIPFRRTTGTAFASSARISSGSATCGSLIRSSRRFRWVT